MRHSVTTPERHGIGTACEVLGMAKQAGSHVRTLQRMAIAAARCGAAALGVLWACSPRDPQSVELPSAALAEPDLGAGELGVGGEVAADGSAEKEAGPADAVEPPGADLAERGDGSGETEAGPAEAVELPDADLAEPDVGAGDLGAGEVSTVGFVLVSPGTFTMGSPEGELGRQGDEVQHEVTLTRGFYLGVTEVTQWQWKWHMGSNPSQFDSCADDCPVEHVTWWQVLAYANAASSAQGLPECYSVEDCYELPAGEMCTVIVNAPGSDPYGCQGYRLPTEAEWEYAYRAGTTTAFYNGDITDTGFDDPNLDAIGWYYGNSTPWGPHPVASKQPNAWGLYDMAGNVAEWTWDRDGTYPAGAVTDPAGPPWGTLRVIRGGSWDQKAGKARAASRDRDYPYGYVSSRGFRLARSAP
jgi:formylglycine-generating enzyme required for sulfatase activity